MAYKQPNNPFAVTSCGRRRTFTQGGNPGDDRTKESPFKPRKYKKKKDPLTVENNKYKKKG